MKVYYRITYSPDHDELSAFKGIFLATGSVALFIVSVTLFLIAF